MFDSDGRPTEAQIAQHYRAAMDSVNIINGAKPNYMTEDEWSDCVARNKQHLRIMLEKDFWTIEDLEPLRLAAQ